MAKISLNGITDNEERLILHMVVNGLTEHLGMQNVNINFIDEEPEGDYEFLPGCCYIEGIDRIYIQKRPENKLAQYIGIVAHSMYAVNEINKGAAWELLQDEADIFGDFYQLTIYPESKLLTKRCTSQHMKILSFHGEKYWNAIGTYMNNTGDNPGQPIMKKLWGHYTKNAWELYKRDKIQLITGDVVDYAENDGLFSPELYLTLVHAPIDIQEQLIKGVRRVAAILDDVEGFNLRLAYFESGIEKGASTVPEGNVTQFASLPQNAQNLYCGTHIATDEGIVFLDVKVTEGNQKPEIKRYSVSEAPITIAKIYKNNETSLKLFKIIYKDVDWEEIIVNASSILDSGVLKKIFGDRGIYADYRRLSTYLKELANLNKADRLKAEGYTDSLGWVGGELVPYSDKCDFISTESSKNRIKEAFACVGDADKWIEVVNSIRADGYVLVKIALAASFSSVMKALYQNMSDTYIVSFYGAPKSGKSVTLKLGASIWGDCRQLVGNFNESKPYIYSAAALMKDFPFFLDDTANTTIPSGEEFSQLIYALFAGRGKSKMRGGGAMAEEERWNSCTIITGEFPARSLVRDDKEGAKSRILDIPTPTKMFRDSSYFDKVSKITNEDYGHAGKAFVEAIDKIGGEIISGLFDEYLSLLRSLSYTSGLDTRTLQPMASILLADRIASIYVYRDEANALSVKEFVTAMNAKSSSVDKNGACYSFIIENDEEIVAENNGIIDDSYKEYLIVGKKYLKELAASYDLDEGRFAKWLKDRELLLTDKGKTTKNKRIDGKATPMYFIKRTGIEKKIVTETEEDMVLEERTVSEISNTIRKYTGLSTANTEAGTTEKKKERTFHRGGLFIPVNDVESNSATKLGFASCLEYYVSGEYDLLMNHLEYIQTFSDIPEEMKDDYYTMRGLICEKYLSIPNPVEAEQYYSQAVEVNPENPIAKRHFEMMEKLNLVLQKPNGRDLLKNYDDEICSYFGEALAINIYERLEKDLADNYDHYYKSMTSEQIDEKIKEMVEEWADELPLDKEREEVQKSSSHMIRYYHPELIDFTDKKNIDEFYLMYAGFAPFRTTCDQRWVKILCRQKDFLPQKITSLLADYIENTQFIDDEMGQTFMREIIESGGSIPKDIKLLISENGNAETRLLLAEKADFLTNDVAEKLATDESVEVRRALAARAEKFSFKVRALLSNDEDEEVSRIMQNREN